MFGLVREPLTHQYVEQFICEYGFVRQEQLARLFSDAGFPIKKARSYQNALRTFSKKLFYDKKTDAFYSCNYEEPTPERFFAIDKSLWVLIDFLRKVEHHFPVSSAFSPSQICMMLEERSYEIAYCPAGLEQYFNNQLRAARTELLYRTESSFFQPIVEKNDKAVIESTRYIIILEDIEKAQLIRSSLISYFVTLDKDNTCTFFPAEDVYAAAQA